MTHARNLLFEEKPDYLYLRTLLISLCDKEGIDLQDKYYDWVSNDSRVIPKPLL